MKSIVPASLLWGSYMELKVYSISHAFQMSNISKIVYNTMQARYESFIILNKDYLKYNWEAIKEWKSKTIMWITFSHSKSCSVLASSWCRVACQWLHFRNKAIIPRIRTSLTRYWLFRMLYHIIFLGLHFAARPKLKETMEEGSCIAALSSAWENLDHRRFGFDIDLILVQTLIVVHLQHFIRREREYQIHRLGRHFQAQLLALSEFRKDTTCRNDIWVHESFSIGKISFLNLMVNIGKPVVPTIPILYLCNLFHLMAYVRKAHADLVMVSVSAFIASITVMECVLSLFS